MKMLGIIPVVVKQANSFGMKPQQFLNKLLASRPTGVTVSIKSKSTGTMRANIAQDCLISYLHVEDVF